MARRSGILAAITLITASLGGGLTGCRRVETAFDCHSVCARYGGPSAAVSDLAAKDDPRM